MKFKPLAVPGAWLIELEPFTDNRGWFVELFRNTEFQAATGRALEIAQINASLSGAGTIRGMHSSVRPPGQAKYVTCLTGEILDVVLDVRVESKTFGEWTSVSLNSDSPCAIFLAEGLAHGFQAISETALVAYATTAEYDSGLEFSVQPLDQTLGLPWAELGHTVLSSRDRTAPTLKELHGDALSPLWRHLISVEAKEAAPDDQRS